MTKQSAAKNINKNALKNLISRGKERGYLSYDEINRVLPDDMLSPDQIDETLVLFNDLNIEIVDEKKRKVADTVKKTRKRRQPATVPVSLSATLPQQMSSALSPILSKCICARWDW